MSFRVVFLRLRSGQVFREESLMLSERFLALLGMTTFGFGFLEV